MPKVPNSSMDMTEILRLAQTDAGKQLISMLRRDSGAALSSAVEKASRGEYAELQSTVQNFLSTPAARALAEQLRRESHG